MKPRNWTRVRRNEMLKKTAREASDLVRFRPIIAEGVPPPRLEIFDSRGRRISLPRLTILEREDAVA